MKEVLSAGKYRYSIDICMEEGLSAGKFSLDGGGFICW
jgi:hypothetical protein